MPSSLPPECPDDDRGSPGSGIDLRGRRLAEGLLGKTLSGSESVPDGLSVLLPVQDTPDSGQLELLPEDQRRRWERGAPLAVEHYLRLAPALADHPTLLLDLIYQEYTLREAHGEAPSAEEYVARFPSLADAIRRQLQLHQALLSAPDYSTGSVTDDTPALLGAPRAGAVVPRLLGGYELLEELGSGGMGVVYKARQPGLNRIVALKMILAGAHGGADARQRFLAEAELIARLSHPNIVQVYEFGEHEGNPFFSLEFVEGGSLAEALRGEPQQPMTAVQLVEQLVRGVAYAHEKGVVHRDLKPANVLLAVDGTPKITDFGLAKHVEGDSGITRSGQVLGTPSYMAPEQAAGRARDVGVAADVYALGALLYECLTGRPPFRGATVRETLRLVNEQDPVSPRVLQPSVPRELETICLKCLEKDPTRRYASATALAEDLGRWKAGEPVLARPIGRLEHLRRWARRKPALAGLYAVSAAALLLLIGLGFWFSARLGAAQGRVAVAEAEARRREADAARSRDVARTEGYYRILITLRQRQAAPRPGWTWEGREQLRTAAREIPPDLRLTELRTEGAAVLGAVDVRLARLVGKGVTPEAVAFSPDGKRLALGEGRAQAFGKLGVLLVDMASGKTERELLFPPSLAWQIKSRVQDGARSIAFSLDGRFLAVGARSGMIHFWDLQNENPTVQSWEGHADEVRQLQFLPQPPALLSVGRDLVVRRWDVATQKPAGEWKAPAPVDNVVWDAHSRRLLACQDIPEGRLIVSLDLETLTPKDAGQTVSPGGPLAFTPEGRMGIMRCGRQLNLIDGETARHLRWLHAPNADHAHEEPIDELAVSPDGQLVATSSRQTRHVRIWDLVGMRLLQDLNAEDGAVKLAFAPGGGFLAVTGQRQTRLYEFGGRREQTFLPLRGLPRGMAWMPDGRALFCVGNRLPTDEPMEYGVWLAPDGHLAHARPDRFGTLPLGGSGLASTAAVSPDGRQFAFADAHNLHVRGLDAPAALDLPLRNVERLQFAPDGRLWGIVGLSVRAWTMPPLTPAVTWSQPLGTVVKAAPGIKALAAGRRWVVVGGDDGDLRLLRALEERPTSTTWQLGTKAVRSLVLNPEETLAAAGISTGEVHLVRVPEGDLVASGQAHEDVVTAVAFADKEGLLTGSRDQTVRLWRRSAHALHEVLTLRFPGPVQDIALSSGGRELAVLVEGEWGVRIWRLDRLHAGLNAVGLGSN